jgi:hypothetical protein
MLSLLASWAQSFTYTGSWIDAIALFSGSSVSVQVVKDQLGEPIAAP